MGFKKVQWIYCVFLGMVSVAGAASWFASDPLVDGHDPSIIRTEKGYVLQTTNNLLLTRTSTDLIHWEWKNKAFSAVPAWLLAIGNVENIWAPDLARFNDKYWSYYTGSVFGKNTSGLGALVTDDLDVDATSYTWTDLGEVHRSVSSDHYNAIDADIVLDDTETPWMAFGSWWQGIRLVKLDPSTGKRADNQIHSIANRGGSGIEGPSILKRGHYYYLFTSWDVCCVFDPVSNTTYNTRMGRASQVTGPYVDRSGKALLDGGGTLMLSRYFRYYGPGGGSAFWDVNRPRFVNHFYDTLRTGNPPTLQIRDLVFTDDDWPEMGQPFLGRYMSAEAEHGIITNALISASSHASNGEYVAYINEADSKIRLPMFIPHAGKFLLRYRYANGGNPATHIITVNHGNPITLDLPATTAWARFSEGEEVFLTADLKRGGNFIEVTRGTEFAELDRIDFFRLVDTLPAYGFDQGAYHAMVEDSMLALDHGGWTLYENVVFDSITPDELTLQVQNCRGGTLEMRADDLSQPPFATCNLPSTCGSGSWTQVTCSITKPSGVHDVYASLQDAGSGTTYFGDFVFASSTTSLLPIPPVSSPPAHPWHYDLLGRRDGRWFQ